MESKLAKMSQVFAHGIALSSSNSTATIYVGPEHQNGSCWYKGSVQMLEGHETVCWWILITEDAHHNTSWQDNIKRWLTQTWIEPLKLNAAQSAISPLSKLG